MKERPWLSGHCNASNPPKIHAQCKGGYARHDEWHPCSCFCHMAPDPSPAPDVAVSVEPTPADDPAAGPASAGEAPRLGIYEDLDELEYHADPTSVSASGMKEILRSPAHFLHSRTHPKTSDSMDLGTIAHTLILGTGQEYVAVEGHRNRNDVKAAIAEAEAEGKLVLKPDQLKAAERMADAVLTHRTAGPLFLDPGRSELSMFWHDPVFDVIRRCRWDRFRDDGVGVDLKTGKSAEPFKDIPKAILDWKYDLSASWYLAVAAGLGVDVTAFALVFVEATEPHPVVVVEPDDEFLARGAALAEKALTTYRNCLDEGTWPGYLDDGFLTVAPPPWAATAEQITATIPARTESAA